MGGANELRGMQLPPPDLSVAYAQLPKPWKVGAVLLADRILAAAYADDVRSCAMTIAEDLAAGAVRGMTLEEYVDEACAGHARVVDLRRALDVFKYSPSMGPFWPALAGLTLSELCVQLFAQDVQDQLAAMGVALYGEGDDPQ